MPTPSFEGVIDAARQIAPAAVRTPLIEHPALNEAVGGRVLMKAETFQVAGAFKFRGAYNRISRLTNEEKTRGVVAYSSGNHAQGVAAAAQAVGTPALIVMPSDSPAVKVEGVRAFGGEVRFYDRWTESREAIGAGIAAERGSVLVPPFDDPFIIEGQGTVGLEMLEQTGVPMDQLLCGASGGGLIAGINLVMAEQSPDTRVIVVEPDAFDDTRRSLAAATVTDAEVAQAMRFAFRSLKLVIEPGGAVSLAALLAGKVEVKGLTTGIVLSGGNVDPGLFSAVIEGRFEG